MEFYAAIDLRGGQAVRLLQGDYAKETEYGDPIALAQEFIDGGTSWLHLVDLDGARDSSGANRSIIKEIISMSPVPVEVGGGIRSLSDVEELVEASAARVIVGTQAVEAPDLVAEMARQYPGVIGIGLDYRRHGNVLRIAVRGWLEDLELTMEAAFERLVPPHTAAVILTAIDRDGTLEGPDLEGLTEALAVSSVPVVASAGIGSLSDVQAVASLHHRDNQRRVAGVVVGKALVEGKFTVGDGVAACK